MARLPDSHIISSPSSSPLPPALILPPTGDLSLPPATGSPGPPGAAGSPASLPPAPPLEIPAMGDGPGCTEDAVDLDSPHILPVTASANTMIAGRAPARSFNKESGVVGTPKAFSSGNDNDNDNDHCSIPSPLTVNSNNNTSNNNNNDNSNNSNTEGQHLTKTSNHSSCSTSSTSAGSHHLAAWPADWVASATVMGSHRGGVGVGGGGAAGRGGKEIGSQLQGLLHAHALAQAQASGRAWPHLEFNDDPLKGDVRGPPPLNSTSEPHPSHRSRKDSNSTSVSRENHLLSQDISKAVAFPPRESLPDENACSPGSWFSMSRLTAGVCTTDLDEEEEGHDHEDVEWETRRRLTGAAGRMVQYETGEFPRQDFMLKGGIGKRIIVSAVAEGGKAHYTGIKPGDVLVSINGSKDFLGLSAQEVHGSLRAPVTLVFLGFVGKLQAEVRLNHRSRVLGLRSVDPVLVGYGDAPVQVTDEVVFKPEKASLMLFSGTSGACSSAGTVPPSPTPSAARERRPTFSQTGSGLHGGHEQGDDGIQPESESEDERRMDEEGAMEEEDEDDDEDEEDVLDIDAVVAARSASNVSKAYSLKAPRDLPAVYELRCQDARRILKNVLVESKNATVTLTKSVALF